MTEDNRQVGTVKQYNETKGYGFLTVQGVNQDYFLHVSELRKAHISGPILAGDKFSFVVEQHTNGLRAKSVKKVDPHARS